MNNPIKEIYRFNKEAGLLDAGYDDKRECAYPIEEMLEGFNLGQLAFAVDAENNPKDISRAIISVALEETLDGHINIGPLTDVDRLDKHLDAIIFNFGSIFKLGLTPQQAMKALGVVMSANLQKLKAGQDDQGKQLKPEGFVGPEVELQKILDERNSDD